MSKLPEGNNEKQSGETISIQEQLAMIVGEFNNGDVPHVTSEHVGQLIEQRSVVNTYIHEDQKMKHERYQIDRKNDLHFLYAGGVIIIILFVCVVFKAPEYVSELITAIFAGGGGYGLGHFKALQKKSYDK